MPVSAQETIFQHVGNGVTVTFPYGCQVAQQSDLKVYVNDVQVTSGFAVSGIGVPTGGAVTFDSPPANLASVLLERDIVLERVTDYQQNGDFLSRVVNPDFNRLWMALQQHLAILRSAIVAPKSESTGPGLLPLPAMADRANKLLSFDAAGNPVAVAPAAQTSTALQALLAAFSGSMLVGFIQAGIGAVMRTMQDKAREWPSFADRGASSAADATVALQNALNIGYGFGGYDSYSVSAPIRIPSLAHFRGPAAGTAFIGTTATVKRAIRKTTNTTVAVKNFESNVTTNQDCIAYIDPAWIDAGVAYPQKTTLERLAFQGFPGAPNSHGIYIEQGGGFAFRDLQFSHVVNAIYAKECWSSVVENIQAAAKIVWLGGTSVTFTNIGTGAGPGSNGGFSFSSLIYSTMNSCWVDGATDTAYRFVNSKLTLNGCGCEGSTTATANSGTAIAFDGGDEILLNNFNCVPKVNQVLPIYTVGFDSTITFNQGCSGFAVAGVNCPDLYVWGNGSTVIFNDYKFWGGTRDTPVIQFAVGITTTKVIVKYGTSTKIYTSDGSGATLIESVNDAGTFVPSLTFGGAAVGMTYGTRTGKWQKNGKIITGDARITLTAKGSSAGAAVLSGWPAGFVPLGDVQVNFGLVASITGGPISAVIDAGTTTAGMLLRGATGDGSMSEASFTNTTVLRFSFSYTVA